MRIFLVIVSVLLVPFLVFSQGIVPKKMDFAGMTLELSNSARGKIQAEVNRIRKSEKHFMQMVAKADIHFQVVEEVFRQEGFPDDIKYLLIQESAFNADAVSSSNAVGYWQFKEGTAKEVGLTVEHGIDERKNLAAASRGAAKYMAKTNMKLDNWIFALLSYNVGPGGVMKYYKDKYKGVRKMDIDGDIHWYVIKFLAHKIAYEDDLHKNAPQLVLSVSDSFEGKNLKQIAKSENVDEEVLSSYNRWISDHKKIPDDKTYYVVLPKEGTGGQVFASNPKGTTVPKTESKSGLNWPPKPEQRQKKPAPVYTKEKINEGDAAVKHESPKDNIRYKVNDVDVIVAKEGDNSNHLAIIGGITKKKFLKYNEIQSFTQMNPGTTYYLKSKKNSARINFHVVQKGEQIWDVSQAYGIKSAAIRRKNLMGKKEEPNEGRVLWLRMTRPATVPVEYKDVSKPDVSSAKKEMPKQAVEASKEKVISKDKETVKTSVNTGNKEVIHIVKPGETLYSISRQYDVSVETLKTINNLSENALSVGDELLISKAKETTRQSSAKKYTVQQGDTLYSISRKFNISVSDLLNKNAKTDGTLSVGEVLIIE